MSTSLRCLIAFACLMGSALMTTPAAQASGSAASSPPPIGAAVDTAAPHAGGGYEIEIGGNCTPILSGCRVAHYPYGSRPVQLLVLNRTTLAEVADLQLSGDAADAAQAAAAVKQDAGTKYLVILGDLPGHEVNSGYETAMYTITGAAYARALNLGGGFAGVGVPQSPVKSGNESGTVNPGSGDLAAGHVLGDLRGFLQQSPGAGAQPYSFISGRYAAYDTHAAGSGGDIDVIRVGSARYTLSLPHQHSCTGGWALLVLNGATLAPTSKQAIATNCSNEVPNQNGWRALAEALSEAAGVQFGTRLVLLQSIGNPTNPGSPGSLPLASGIDPSIRGLGADAETWQRALVAGNLARTPANSAYALVGSVAIGRDAVPAYSPDAYAPVAATALNHRPARLQGLLRADADSNYVPVSGAATGQALAPSLPTIVWQKATPWPTGGTLGQLQVLEFLSAGAPFPDGTTRYQPLQVTGASCYRPAVPDVRFDFCDLSAPWANVLTEVNKSAVPAGCNCAAGDWRSVRLDISRELGYRTTVINYLGLITAAYVSSGQTSAQEALASTASKIERAVTVSNRAQITGGRWDSLGSDTFNVLSALSYSNPDIGAISNALNDISAFGYLLGDIFGFSQSGNSLAARVQTSAAALGKVLSGLYADSAIGLAQAESIILSDYGKLRTAGSSPSFQLSLPELQATAPALKIGAERFVFNHLLPVAYRSYALLQTGINPVALNRDLSTPNTPASYVCTSGADPRQFHQPWAKAAKGDWTLLSSGLGNDPLGHARALGLVLSAPPPEGGAALTPPSSLIKQVTGPVKIVADRSVDGLGEGLLSLLFHHFHQYALACHYYSRTTYGPSVFPWP